MEEKILAALVDLQVALGKLQSSMTDVDRAIRKLMAVQVEALQSKTGAVAPGDRGVVEKEKEGSTLGESAEPPIFQS